MQRLAGILFIFFMFSILISPVKQAEAKYASLIMDVETGEIFHSVNADVKKHPASLTKIMTLYMVFEALEQKKVRKNTKWKVSSRAARQRPSKLGLRAGSYITVEQAILALVTKSANDVAVVVAEALGKSEKNFAALMTKKARKIGMKNTTFKNASGLHTKGQLSTARDMARLGIRIRKDFPKYYDYFSKWKFKYKHRTYYNHNKLLRYYEGTDGIKTGFTNASGFNLVASVERHGRRLMGVVFGGRTSKSRNAHMQNLLDKGYYKILVDAVRPPAKPSVTKAKNGKYIVTASYENKTNNTAQAIDHSYFKPGQVSAKRISKRQQVLIAGKNDHLPRAPKQPVAVNLKTESPSISKTTNKNAKTKPSDSLDNSQWAIQVGAFSKKTKAHQIAGRAAVEVRLINRNVDIEVSSVKTLTRKLYRARLVGLTKGQARQSCQRLEDSKLNCVVIPPISPDQLASTN